MPSEDIFKKKEATLSPQEWNAATRNLITLSIQAAKTQESLEKENSKDSSK